MLLKVGTGWHRPTAASIMSFSCISITEDTPFPASSTPTSTITNTITLRHKYHETNNTAGIELSLLTPGGFTLTLVKLLPCVLWKLAMNSRWISETQIHLLVTKLATGDPKSFTIMTSPTINSFHYPQVVAISTK